MFKDLSLPIHGFTFKFQSKEFCANEGQHREDCLRKKLEESNALPYYRTCIYGHRLEFNDDGSVKHTEDTKAFIYTPSGLQEFDDQNDDKKYETETQKFCKNILNNWQIFSDDKGVFTCNLTGMAAESFTDF